PKNENAEINIAESTPPRPFGKNPSFLNRFSTPLTSGAKGQNPNMAVSPMAIKITIAKTFIRENQNSNSPKLRVLKKFAKLRSTIKNVANTALDIEGNHACRISAPAIASIGITKTQNHQYNHPMVKPA